MNEAIGGRGVRVNPIRYLKIYQPFFITRIKK
jgi:hypothetical protein